MSDQSNSNIRQPDGNDLRIYRNPEKRVLESQKFHLFAKQLHQTKWVYGLYGVLDGLSLGESMVKYGIDIKSNLIKTSSSDLMHRFLTTPWGLALMIIESLSVMIFSAFGNYFDDKSKSRFKRFFAISWPYIRDVFKGLKNTYKGISSALIIFSNTCGKNLMHLILPMGIALGVLSAVIRLGYRKWVTEDRKTMVADNSNLERKIKSDFYVLFHLNPSLTEEDFLKKYNEFIAPPGVIKDVDQCKYIQSQGIKEKIIGYFSAASVGILDGFYLYLGVLSICPLAPHLFLPMLVISLVYSLLTIAVRFYEEYTYQRDLTISILNAELQLEGAKLTFYFSELLRLSEEISKDQENVAQLKTCQTKSLEQLEQALQVILTKRKELLQLQRFSQKEAFLYGLRDGLVGYGVVASMLFAVSILCTIASASFPPYLLIAGIMTGLGILLTCISYTMYQRARINKVYKQEDELKTNQLMGWINRIKLFKDQLNEDFSTDIDLKKTIVVDPSPQFYLQEIWELFRSFFTSIRKGTGAVSISLSPLQKINETGHYTDSKAMIISSIFMVGLYAFARVLRSIARGFGKGKLSSPNVSEPSEIQTLKKNEDITTHSIEIKNPDHSTKRLTRSFSSSNLNSPSISHTSFLNGIKSVDKRSEGPITTEITHQMSEPKKFIRSFSSSNLEGLNTPLLPRESLEEIRSFSSSSLEGDTSPSLPHESLKINDDRSQKEQRKSLKRHHSLQFFARKNSYPPTPCASPVSFDITP